MECVVVNGNNLDYLRTLKSYTYNACITDPPYGMDMAEWDKNVPPVETWREVYRVLKPGAFVLSFCAPEFYHRMACKVEDAGFKPRGAISWIVTTKMAKRNRLKPAHEIIFVGQKQLDGSINENWLRWGCGRIEIERDRVAWDGKLPTSAKHGHTRRAFGGEVAKAKDQPLELADANPNGRQPADILGHFDEAEIQKYFHAHTFNDQETQEFERYFYAPRASRKERGEFNDHPTPKPLSLMRHLCRVFGGEKRETIIDPFLGSGSTGVAAILEGYGFIGIDTDKHYCGIARKRIAMAKSKVMDKTQVSAAPSNLRGSLDAGLNDAGAIYGEITEIAEHSDHRVREFVARCSLNTRLARAMDRAEYEALAKERGIRLNKVSIERREIGVMKIAADSSKLNQPRWWNAAAYLAQPKDETPPESVQEALELMERKGGLRACADLFSAKPSSEEPDLLAECDALLVQSKAQHYATLIGEEWAGSYPKDSYVLLVARLDKAGLNGRAWVYDGAEDSTIISLAKKIRKEAGLKALSHPRAVKEVKAVVSKIKAAKAKREAEAPAPAAAKPELQQGECPVCCTMQPLNRSGTFGSHRRANLVTGKGTFACDGKNKAPVAGTVTPVSEAAEAAE